MRNLPGRIYILFCMLACISVDIYADECIETKEDLNRFNVDTLHPLGDFFWDEFPEYEKEYVLTKSESEILGKWTTIDKTDGLTNGNSFYFYPNGLLVIHFAFGNYVFNEEDKTLFNKCLGVWYLENGVIKAEIHNFIIKRYIKKSDDAKILLQVKPYQIEILSHKDINPIGYAVKPFNDFRFPEELAASIIDKGKSKNIYIMARGIFTWDIMRINGPVKDYGYFKIVPQMAEEGLNGLDIAQSPDLIKKYIWDLWP